MTSFRAIIDKWPSLQAFADDLGVKYVTAQLMRHRDSIASKHWNRAVTSAHKRKIHGVTLEVLAALQAAKQERRARPKARVQRHGLQATACR